MNQLSFYLGGLRASGKDQRTAKRQQKAGGVLADYGVELREAKAGGKDFLDPGVLADLRLAFFRSVWGGDEAIARLSAAGVTLGELMPNSLFVSYPELEEVLRMAIDEGGEKGAPPTLAEARAAEAGLKGQKGPRVGLKEFVREAVLAGVKEARTPSTPAPPAQQAALDVDRELAFYLSGIETRRNN